MREGKTVASSQANHGKNPSSSKFSFCLDPKSTFFEVLEEMKSQGCEVDSDQALAVPSLRRAIRDLQEWQMSQKLSKPAAAPAAAAAPSDDAGLPDGWQSTLDPSSGQRYYWNVGDPAGTTTWERPT